MAPLGSQPTVIEVEPADHSTDVESTKHRVELVVGPRNLGAVWNDGPWDDWTEELCAFGKLEGLETTT